MVLQPQWAAFSIPAVQAHPIAFHSPSHGAVIRVYDTAGNVVETHETRPISKRGRFLLASRHTFSLKNETRRGILSPCMIAISYRREDTAPITGRIYDRLQAILGRDQVNVMETHQQAGVLTHLGPQISPISVNVSHDIAKALPSITEKPDKVHGKL